MEFEPQFPFLEAPQPQVREPFWDYYDLAILLGLSVAALLMALVCVIVLGSISPAIKKDPLSVALPVQFVFYGLIYLAFRFTFSSRYGQPVFSSLGWRLVPFNPSLVIFSGIALAFVVSAIAAALHTPAIPSPFDKLTGSPFMLVLFGLFALIIGPISEELIFRGFLQPLLSRTFGVAAGIVLTAAVFGLLHGQEYSWAWQYVVAVSLAGVAFGWLRAKTRSVIPSTLMHGGYNAVFVVALVASKYFVHK